MGFIKVERLDIVDNTNNNNLVMAEYAVFIGGIPKTCDRNLIYKTLKKHCYVRKLDMPKAPEGSRQKNKGHCFLHVENQEEVDKLLEMGKIQIRNTICDICPYNKNERRIQEEKEGRVPESLRVTADNSEYSYNPSSHQLTGAATPQSISNSGYESETNDFPHFEKQITIVPEENSEEQFDLNFRNPINVEPNQLQPFSMEDRTLELYVHFTQKYGVSPDQAHFLATHTNTAIVTGQITFDKFINDFDQTYQINLNRAAYEQQLHTQCQQTGSIPVYAHGSLPLTSYPSTL